MNAISGGPMLKKGQRLRIPMMSATNSDLKSATYSNLKPAMVPI
jgi:hypothetical protein